MGRSTHGRSSWCLFPSRPLELRWLLRPVSGEAVSSRSTSNVVDESGQLLLYNTIFIFFCRRFFIKKPPRGGGGLSASFCPLAGHDDRNAQDDREACDMQSAVENLACGTAHFDAKLVVPNKDGTADHEGRNAHHEGGRNDALVKQEQYQRERNERPDDERSLHGAAPPLSQDTERRFSASSSLGYKSAAVPFTWPVLLSVTTHGPSASSFRKVIPGAEGNVTQGSGRASPFLAKRRLSASYALLICLFTKNS